MNDSVAPFVAVLSNGTNGTNSSIGKTGYDNGIPIYGRIYLAMGLFGFCVNSLAFMVVRRRKIISGRPTRWYLINQCVCDGTGSFLLAIKWIVGSDFTVPANAFGDFVCMFWYNSRPYWICVMVSLFNTTSLSVEHYLGVVYPTRHRRMYTKRNLVLLLATSWILATGFESIGMVQSERNGDTCVERLTSPLLLLLWGIGVIIVEILVPLPMVVYCNVRMIVTLLQRAPGVEASGANERRKAHSKERVARDLTFTVIVLSCVMALCTYPDIIYFTLYMVGLIEIDFNGWMHHLGDFLVNMHLTINPVIYVLQMRNFRTEVAGFFSCHKAARDGPYVNSTHQSPQGNPTICKEVKSGSSPALADEQ